MIELFPEALSRARTLDEVSQAILNVLSKLRSDNPDQAIAYVAGAITADGFDRIMENSNLLAARTRKVRQIHPLAFSAPDIFTPELYIRINGLSLHQDEYKQFFRKKLRSGCIDVVYLTPGWRRSSGSRDEHETALYLALPIVDMETHPVWRWVDQG